MRRVPAGRGADCGFATSVSGRCSLSRVNVPLHLMQRRQQRRASPFTNESGSKHAAPVQPSRIYRLNCCFQRVSCANVVPQPPQISIKGRLKGSSRSEWTSTAASAAPHAGSTSTRM